MPERSEHTSGDPAPADGTYEQVNVFGRPNGIRVGMSQGQPFPPGPARRDSGLLSRWCFYNALSGPPGAIPGRPLRHWQLIWTGHWTALMLLLRDRRRH